MESLLDRQEDQQRRGIPEDLAWEAGNRTQLFQAQGMVMVQLRASLGEALARMRAYAYAEDRLTDVARDVVNQTLRFERDPT